ncbi:MAG TPA: selenide, water dikinase SelD, partial [Acidimicrobiia bacterium]|nr:selenide, water dikinase SelD [Acidimicrobiia bacterium]
VDVAAANAASDVYAMGGAPLFALNLVAWPRDALPMELLSEVLAGAAEVADRGGWALVGGHTIDGAEPLYGQAVIGDVAVDDLLTNAGARPGDALVLTKAIGTGIVATTLKRTAETGPPAGFDEAYAAAVDSMTRLNEEASRAAKAVSASAATDVTGFGLLGHLHRMCAASGVAARVEVGAVPVLPGARDLLLAGFVAGGTQRNEAFVDPHVERGSGVSDEDVTLLADAQTSGGLVFTCDPSAADDAVARLTETGHDAAVIGAITEGPAGAISLT